MISEILGARYKTIEFHRFASNTAGVDLDLTSVSGMGPADAVIIALTGDDRTIELDNSGTVMEVADGRTPVFEVRTERVEISSGDSAHIVIAACYSDRWGT